MLNFLRKLRRKNMKGKYWKYAIGEIMLVVVGILIALTINDLNQGLKDRKTHSRMTANLLTEFKANLKQIETVQGYQEESLQAAYYLLNLIKSTGAYDLDSLSKWIGKVGNNWSYDAQIGVLNSAMSSSEIHLIRNDSLKNLLYGWEGLTLDLKEEQENAFSAFERLNLFLEEHIQIADAIYFYVDRFPKSKFDSDFDALFESPQFEDLLINRGIYLLDQLEELKRLKATNQLIIQLLSEED